VKLLEKFIEDHSHLLLPCDAAMAIAQRSALQSFLFMYLGIFAELSPVSVSVDTELPIGAGNLSITFSII